MTQTPPLTLMLIWHMHQPEYRYPGESFMALPWVRLHATKDYLDMPLLAAAHENVRVTFNLTPSLLDQLDLYLHGGVDRHLELTRRTAEELSPSEKAEILSEFFHANPKRMINPATRYRELQIRRDNSERDISAFDTADFRDLQVWSNLVWVDPHFYSDPAIATLREKGRNFTEADKESLINFQLRIIAEVVPTFVRLFQEGKIGLSFSPYCHPILPLLCDSHIARVSRPDLPAGERRFSYPDDARAQVRRSAALFEKLTGQKMRGMWPSEGSVSEEAVALIAEEGIRWIATDEAVLARSFERVGQAAPSPHRNYHLDTPHGPVRILFRDHGLSDKIGFVYSQWSAGDAVADFLADLHRIRFQSAEQGEAAVVAVILDGENAWETFENDGRDFLQGLYQALSIDTQIRVVSAEEVLSMESVALPSLHPGSWINADFKIWNGHPEDNRGWEELLCAREALARHLSSISASDPELAGRIIERLHAAEGSDWFWWFGDDHSSPNDDVFDDLFRRNLRALYEMVGESAPLSLGIPIKAGAPPLGISVVEAQTYLSPTVDGRVTHFYEWSGAAEIEMRAGAMSRGGAAVRKMFVGCDAERLFVRLDFTSGWDFLESARVIVAFSGDGGGGAAREFDIPLRRGISRQGTIRYACEEVFEMEIPRIDAIGNSRGDAQIQVTLVTLGRVLERFPDSPARLRIPPRGAEKYWYV